MWIFLGGADARLREEPAPEPRVADDVGSAGGDAADDDAGRGRDGRHRRRPRLDSRLERQRQRVYVGAGRRCGLQNSDCHWLLVLRFRLNSNSNSNSNSNTWNNKSAGQTRGIVAPGTRRRRSVRTDVLVFGFFLGVLVPGRRSVQARESLENSAHQMNVLNQTRGVKGRSSVGNWRQRPAQDETSSTTTTTTSTVVPPTATTQFQSGATPSFFPLRLGIVIFATR